MTTKTMRAAVFRPDVAKAQFETLQIDTLRDDEVLVRLVATGVCHTDITCRNGFMAMPRPIVLGHEGAGIVESVGKGVKAIKSGDRVVMSFLPCGACPNCLKGVPSYCYSFMPGNLTGRRVDGSTALHSDQGDVGGHFFGQSSFSSHSVANERNVVKVRDDAPLELLGPLGCGVQTGAGTVMNVLKPARGDSLCVFGAGGVGLSAVMAGVIEGCNPIIVVEPRADRRKLALELGATHVIDPTDGSNVVAKLQEITAVGLANAIDTSGLPAVMGQALEALGARGKLALISMHALEDVLPVPLIGAVGRGVTIRGINMGDSHPQTFIPKLIDLIMAGRFPLQKLVRYYKFEDINQALDDQDHGQAVKPILRMS
jgi:Zn-dependent alcohol dehydrogenase